MCLYHATGECNEETVAVPIKGKGFIDEPGPITMPSGLTCCGMKGEILSVLILKAGHPTDFL